MKSNFRVKNSLLLRFCANAARFLGLLSLLFAGVFVVFLIVCRVMPGATDSNSTAELLGDILTKLPTMVFIGFVALIFSEFIFFLLAREDEPKWILRHEDKIIYAYVVYLIITYVYLNMQAANPEEASRSLIRIVGFHGVSIVRIVILIGIAITLRKVVGIIKESKTLA